MTHPAPRRTVAVFVSSVALPAMLSAQGAKPAAVAGSRDWVTEQQREDGSWPAPEREDGTSAEVRATSFALLAYLGDGSSTEAGRHRDVVRRGVGWLAGQQGEDGRLGAGSSLHDHAIATWALAQAVVLGATERAPVAQRAIDYLELHGNPGHPEFDSELAAWRGLVRAAAQTARPDAERLLTIDEERFELLRIVLEGRSVHPLESATDLDLAAELVARVALGRQAASKDERVAALRDSLLDRQRGFDDPATAADPRATLFASWALYILGGSGWKDWQKQLGGLRVSQRTDGPLRGTFDPGGSPWCREGGRVTSTALAALSLEIYYRYSRLIR